MKVEDSEEFIPVVLTLTIESQEEYDTLKRAGQTLAAGEITTPELTDDQKVFIEILLYNIGYKL